MGAFETFVNANLGIRKPLILDAGHPTGSSKAAGVVGSEYIDTDTNFIYEKTGENNQVDWAFTRKLGDSLDSNISTNISGVSDDISQVSGDLNLVSNNVNQVSGKFNTLSARFELATGINDVSIKYQDFGLSDYESKPNIVIGLTYDSEQPPTSFYSHALYNVSSTGFNISFSNDIVDENLFLDFFLNGSALSGEYSQSVNPGGSTPGGSTPGGSTSTTLNVIGDTEANIRSRSGDTAGTIMYGTDTDDLYIFDGSEWQTYNNDA